MPLWVVGGGHHPPPSLLDFLVHLMLAAKRAEFLEFNPLGGGLLVLGTAVVLPLALSTLKSDNCAHICSLRSQGGGWWTVGGGKIFLPPTSYHPPPLFQYLRYSSRSYGPSAFANREPQSFIHGHWCDQLHHQTHVVARHHHLAALGQLRHPRHVRRPEIELGPVALEEWRVPPAFFFAQHLNFAFELLVRLDRSRLRYHLAALHVVLFNPAQQQAHVVARATFVQQLLEHFHARYHRLARVPEAHDFHFLANLANAFLDATRHHRAAALDGENVFDRHQERLIHIARRQRNVGVHLVHQLVHCLFPLLFTVQCSQPAHPHHRQIVAGELILSQQFAHFQLHQFQQLRIVHHVHFVQRHHDA